MMDVLLNSLGFLLALGASVKIVKMLAIWQGILRSELALIGWGFLLLAIGFLWGIGTTIGLLPNFGNVLFVLGMTPLVLGSSRIFTFTSGQ